MSEQATKTLQQHLIQAEKRCSAYMKRFNKLQVGNRAVVLCQSSNTMSLCNLAVAQRCSYKAALKNGC